MICGPPAAVNAGCAGLTARTRCFPPPPQGPFLRRCLGEALPHSTPTVESLEKDCRILAVGVVILVNMTANDHELLRQFTREQSQDAFTALVNRHLNLVYTAALRQVRSPELAKEVCQSVFTNLACNAAKLNPDTVLTAWLYQVTRHAAIDVVRREARRQEIGRASCRERV